MMRIAEFHKKKWGGCGSVGTNAPIDAWHMGSFKDVFWDWIIEFYIVILACYMLGAAN